MRPYIVAFVSLIALGSPAVAAAQVQVHVDIGFHLPAPPRLIVVPEVPAVRYMAPAPAPTAGNLFFYNGQYWAFSAGGWYVSGGYNGPWVVVAPDFVPRPVLMVPVQYYHVPPGHWKKWAQQRPPRWQEDWGGEWADKRQWKSRDRDDRDDGREGRKPKDKARGRGHGRDR
jgi:hypothetical protein